MEQQAGDSGLFTALGPFTAKIPDWIAVRAGEDGVVQQVNRQMKDKLYGRRLGGLNRTPQSRTYLFSNITYCGQCGGKFSVIIGGEASKVRWLQESPLP
jgi:hypothetical protein